jgi:MYXO-CTERM domain-containing protein
MSTPRAFRLLLPLLLGLVGAFTVVAAPREAAAQGTCRCNRGCHNFPGQCVQSGTGCAAGYAPFCGTRPDACQAGWVSCSGTCTCVRIPGYDAGVPPTDVPGVDVPGVDVPGTDVPTPTDTGTPVDTGFPQDASVPTDLGTPVDVGPRPDTGTPVDAGTPMDVGPRPDTGTPVDRPVIPGEDVPVSMPDGAAPVDRPVIPGEDVPVSMPDGSTPLDRPVVPGEDVPPPQDAGFAPDGAPMCVCPGGICIAGRCITERCDYQKELGFLCPGSDRVCRVVDGEPYCVPPCLGLTCTMGEFCDETTADQCVADTCDTRNCPVGTVCRRNRCITADDAGAARPDGGDLQDGGGLDGSTGPNTGNDDGGCGCRAAGAPASRGAAGMLLVGLMMALGARRRGRTSKEAA